MNKLTKILIALLVVVAIAAGGLWYFVLRDTSDPEASLDALKTTETTAESTRTSPDGVWEIEQGEDVFAGYRVQEVFASGGASTTATGRSGEVSGEMTIDGAQASIVDITVDVTALESNKSQRDKKIKTTGLETNDFPEALFTITEPIDLGAAEKGKDITVTVKGKLTLHGVTNDVEIEVDARWNGDSIDVSGDTEIEFSDYDIDAPSISGFVEVEDNGVMEFQARFVPKA